MLSSDDKSSNSDHNQLAPFVDRILANPLSFQRAKHPDKVSLRPSSYRSFKSSKLRNKDKFGLKPLDDLNSKEPSKQDASMPRPKSMAEAVALYTGKKYLSKKQKKELEGKPVKKEAIVPQKRPVLSDDEFQVGREDEDSSDEDFQTADEEEDQDQNDAEESSSEPAESDEESEDLEQLKQDLKQDLHGLDDEDEELDSDAVRSLKANEAKDDVNDEDVQKNSETPPTSPDDAADLMKGELVHSKYDDSEFYDIDENQEDRGSNGSNRIYKSWREFHGKPGPLGLLNHGVTCYMNSAVQALCHIPALLHYLVDVHNHKYKDSLSTSSVTQILADTVAKMYKLDNKGEKKIRTINPKRLIKRLQDINCMMSEWQQEDSHEYFMSLMSRLQEDSTPKGVKLNQSIIYDIFGGLLSQTVTCKNCGHISTTAQEFYDLSLGLDNVKKRASSVVSAQQLFELKNKIEAAKSSDPEPKQQLSEFLKQKILLAQEERRSRSQTPEIGESQEQKSPSPEAPATERASQGSDQAPSPPSFKYSLENSIKDFFSPEILKADKKDKSGYTCENCKKTTTAIKISTIERAPETLTVHLKRFRFNGSSSMKVKANVIYPDTLDLTEFTTSMDTPTKYKLSSVIVHQGRSVSSGHYIAHCRQPDGTWATYDDEFINKTKAIDALSDESAYVLLYTRLTHKSIDSRKRKASGQPGKSKKRVKSSR
ncbi:hypothetical protein OGAPHI_006058 [Ogataea philodendri]|uniref:ubiquitinyl hydrolase 1 n=1 Tax=Ogataea philodendri TaxID=1378263 RepID=A0A9P8T174_9ASCO|nr:uncharacterized protein OGAPHI_006058 [Ogataea philodendri]KAH3661879.1 hypothetical protein OGAPHI_006058 [Ogataea philodendri]